MNNRKMDKRCFVIFFSLISFGCDAKSVTCHGVDNCENSTRNGTENKGEISVSPGKDELEELRESVGRVGNKLEGILYEVLKDILQDNSTPIKDDSSNELVKETDPTNISSNYIKPLSPTSVIEDEVIHSNKSETEKPHSNETNTQHIESTKNPLLYNYQFTATDIPTPESGNSTSELSETTENVTKAGAEEKLETSTLSVINQTTGEISRIKRMVHENNDQTQSVESFLESNSEKNNNFRVAPSRNQLDEPNFMGDMMRDERRMRSKDDNVRREPKKEPTEDNKSKRPQDEVSMRHLPMIDNPPIEPSKKYKHEGTLENNTIESPKKRKQLENQRSPKRQLDQQPDFQYQNNQETKKIYRKSDEHMNQRSKSDFQFPGDKNLPRSEGMSNRRTHSDASIGDSSDFQVAPQRETKKMPIQNEDLKVHISNPDSFKSLFTNHPEMKNIRTDETVNRKENTPEESEDSRLGQSYMWANQPSNCYEKNNREDMLEKQHIEDLKYEVTKLRSVVDLLKEQQRLINSFDGDKKNLNTQEMLQVLNQINSNNEKPTPIEKNQQYPIDTTTKTKHEELGQIKVQLKDAIENLNRTKEILNLEHKKEMNLETELKTQKTEINWLKLIIENFIIAQAKKKLKDDPSNAKVIESGEIKAVNDTSIVGAKTPTILQKKPHNRTIPSTVKMAEEKLMELESMKSRESSLNEANDREINRRMKNVEVGSPKARASSMSNLEKILDSLSDKQSKSIDDEDNFQNKLLDAVKQLRKKKEEESITKDLLRKLQLNTVESKSEDDMLVKFQKALKALDNPQSKNDDLDIEDQLKVLQREINKLKPNEDLSLFSGELKSPEEDSAQLQIMLTKLIANNPQLQGMKLPPITPQQLMQLQKKFGKRPGIVPPVMGGNDFGATPPASLINAFSPGMGKVGPLYGPYSPNINPYGPNAYGKDLDITSSLGSLGSYTGGYGLGQDLSKIMSYGAPQSNSYSSTNGFPGPNDYAGNLGYFGANNGYLAGGNYGSGSGTGPAYPAHSNNYPVPSMGLYGPSKPSYSGGVMPGYSMFSSTYKNTYGKPQDVGYSVNPYNGQPLTYSNPAYGPKVDQYGNDKQTYGNNFFQVTQPSSYGSGPPAPYYPPKAVDAPSPEKIYGNQPPYSPAGPPYASDKIEELKTQIYALQNAISTYNRPEYIQTAEDKSTIHNLEQQIEELKGIVNSLNGYSGEQQNYPSGGTSQYEPTPYSAPNDPKPADSYIRENEKKIKRSTQEELTKGDNTLQHTVDHKDNDLWDKITSFFGKTISEGFDGIGNKTRRKRSVDDNDIEDGSSSNVMDKLTTVLREVLDDDTDTQSKSPFGVGTTSMNSMNPSARSSENQQGNAVLKQTSLQDIKKQIDHLKKQLGTPKSSNEVTPDKLRTAEVAGQKARSSARHAILPDPSYGFNYALNPFPLDLSVKSKKLDIFKEIVAKIMDKVIESLPIILQKLFGFAVHELTAYGDDHGAAYGTDSSYLTVFRNLGIFGYLPLILLRVVNAISTFIYVLQKNKFLKYFLVPAGVVLLVTGGMVFLIWWMQPGDYYVNYDKLSYDKEGSYGGDYYSGDYGKNSGQIVKTYGVEDGKSRINAYNHGGDAKALQPSGYPAFYKPNLVGPSDNQMPVYNE